MKVMLLIIVIPVLLLITILFCIILGSLIRYMNEGDSFKSPMESQKPIETMLKDREFYKTLVTGFFVLFTMITIVNIIREW